MHDAFISYHTASSRQLADAIVEFLEAKGLSCYYAPRNLVGEYQEAIVHGIEQAGVFIVILNEGSCSSGAVRNELEIATNRNIPIIPFHTDDAPLSRWMEYYVRSYQWVDATTPPVEASFDVLLASVNALLSNNFLEPEDTARISQTRRAQATQNPQRRSANKYFELYGDQSTQEQKWLHTQEGILRDFDNDVYDHLLAGKSGLSVLDIGTNDGNQVVDRLGSRPEVKSILGIDANPLSIDAARNRHGSADSRYAFEVADCESDDFETILQTHLMQHGASGFDFVNISMVILHLKRAYRMLKTVRKLMNPGGVVFIRDIDDGLNIAEPDDAGMFARLNKLCFELPTTGFRHSGRQIPALLTNAGFTRIRMPKAGISTVGMNHDERTALFETSFGWLGGDLTIRAQQYPDNTAFEADRDWFFETYDDMEEAFQREDFFYQEGFMIFTAEK